MNKYSTIVYFANEEELIIFIEGYSPITIINNDVDYENKKDNLIFIIDEYNNSDNEEDKKLYFNLIKEMISTV